MTSFLSEARVESPRPAFFTRIIYGLLLLDWETNVALIENPMPDRFHPQTCPLRMENVIVWVSTEDPTTERVEELLDLARLVLSTKNSSKPQDIKRQLLDDYPEIKPRIPLTPVSLDSNNKWQQ